MAMTRYRLFGLTIASEFPLDGLDLAPPTAAVNVTISCGPIDGPAALEVEGIARFAISDGRQIIVEAVPAVPPADVRLFLLGSAFGLLLAQRGLLPLHANAVELGEGAIAVAGASGAGKSTLAAWFHDHGHRLVGDDVCAIDPNGGRAIVHPGVPRLRLWGGALEATGRGRTGLARSYLSTDDEDKWDVPVAPERRVHGGLPLHAIYVLDDGATLAIEPLGGAEAAEALFAHTYRGGAIQTPAAVGRHWQLVTALLASVPVYRVTRPFDLSRLGQLGTALRAHGSRHSPRAGGADRS